MSFTALTRKSVTDLTRRKARAFFTVLTLAIAVASVGIFALNPLMDRAMTREVAANRLPDVTVSMTPLALTQGELERLARLPNVTTVEPRNLFATRVYVGARRDKALIVGIPDFANQHADVVAIESGAAPRTGAVLVDRNDRTHTKFTAGIGGAARVLSADGSVQPLRISGVASNLTGADRVVSGFITFYTDVATVARLSGATGYTSLGFRLRDNSRAAAERTVAAVRAELRSQTAFRAFDDMPVIQDPGGYPGKSEWEKLGGIFTIVTLLALLTALVLVSNTMSTLIGEQTGEIAAMKAIGARRRDIRRLYLRTTLLFGALGALAGSLLGILLANVLVQFFANLGFGISAGWGVSVPIVIASVIVGLIAPPLAALPAIRRAARLPLAEALQASGSAVGGQGRLDALLRHFRFLPRTAQIGLRGVARRKRRSLATVVQVGLAVATLLALLSLGAGVGKTTRQWFDQNHFDIWVQAVASKPFNADARRLITSTSGVAQVQPGMTNEVRVQGKDVSAWGLQAQPLMSTDVRSGRWYTEAEVAGRARVAVLGRTIAATTGKRVGDLITLRTASGPVPLRVIGISGNQADNGSVVFLPVTTLQAALGSPDAVNSFWITTASQNHGFIDRVTTSVEDSLAAHGSQVATLVNYDAKQKQVAMNGQITASISVLGLLIVAISMVGLINTITMAVLERTREIGMLRSVGARARDVRRIFATEGLVVAGAGWLLGVPLGYLFARGIVWLAGRAVGLDIAFVFPLTYALIALLGTVILALLVMLAPLRQAVRFKPGEAIRYA
jgi:putative ABC transport system permease protein